jgi:hypothetical protein
VKKLKSGETIDCRVCGVNLVHRMHLQSHAEKFHGTVLRVSTSVYPVLYVSGSPFLFSSSWQDVITWLCWSRHVSA